MLIWLVAGYKAPSRVTGIWDVQYHSHGPHTYTNKWVNKAYIAPAHAPLSFRIPRRAALARLARAPRMLISTHDAIARRKRNWGPQSGQG